MSIADVNLAGRNPQDEGHIKHVVRPRPDEIASATSILERIDRLLQVEKTGRLVGADGSKIELPQAVAEALRHVIHAVAAGHSVLITPEDNELTTQQAADLLHVSRPHLIKLLDDGEISFRRLSDDPASHRRVLMRDVLTYKEQRRRKRRALLDELTRDAEDSEGGYI